MIRGMRGVPGSGLKVGAGVGEVVGAGVGAVVGAGVGATVSTQKPSVHLYASLKKKRSHSASDVHALRPSHAAQEVPPQSIPVSSPFIAPSSHVATHTRVSSVKRLLQLERAQSESPSQDWSTAQVLPHDPPQSMSVSSWFLKPSEHDSEQSEPVKPVPEQSQEQSPASSVVPPAGTPPFRQVW